ncbi:MAG: hypothetical protein JRI47_07355, partial [Deltaproteobacteria bacterium]|nr:hypothetical protein [Deltaproteobacteria bacterium]
MELKHQALLLAYLIRDVPDCFGKEGEEVITEAIQTYGEGRGKRMARTALKDGCRNDLVGYLLYGEVDPDDTGNKFRIQIGMEDYQRLCEASVRRSGPDFSVRSGVPASPV